MSVSTSLGLGFGFGLEAAGYSEVVGEVSTTEVDEGQGEALGGQETVVAVERALVPAGVNPCLQRVLEPAAVDRVEIDVADASATERRRQMHPVGVGRIGTMTAPVPAPVGISTVTFASVSLMVEEIRSARLPPVDHDDGLSDRQGFDGIHQAGLVLREQPGVYLSSPKQRPGLCRADATDLPSNFCGWAVPECSAVVDQRSSMRNADAQAGGEPRTGRTRAVGGKDRSTIEHGDVPHPGKLYPFDVRLERDQRGGNSSIGQITGVASEQAGDLARLRGRLGPGKSMVRTCQHHIEHTFALQPKGPKNISDALRKMGTHVNTGRVYGTKVVMKPSPRGAETITTSKRSIV